MANVHVLPWALQCIRVSVTKYSSQGVCACAMMPRDQRGHEPVRRSVGVARPLGSWEHITCLTLAQVEGATRYHGCRVVGTSGNGGDGCEGLLLGFLPCGPACLAL